jgi:TFIIF-interacting CTD phosphatase-like protein
MSRMTISGGITVSVSQEEGQLIAQQDAQRLRKLRKLSLVLDLDHTLVHATWDGQAQQQVHHADVRSLLLSVPVMEGDVRREIRMQHFVKLRPNLKAFLSKCQARYEFGVYTAGTRDYAEEVTLILARHLVGADRDEIDLERLRQAVAQAELDLQRKAKTADAKSDKSATAQGKASSGEGTAGANADTVNGASSEGGNSEELSRKRKRVAFGEPPAEQKTDELTPQALADLKRELEEAEAQEARAVEAKQRLFGSRVVSRTDVGDLGRDVKSLRRIFPCGGTMAAVVDDREDVWANAQDQVTSTDQRKRPGEPPDNLLLVRPYHWDTFLGFADVNNASGADLSSSSPADSKPSSSPKRGSSESDQQLLWTSDVLMRLHERYYQHNNESGDDAARPSVPEILASMRREVLRGCNVVLSGLIPIHKQNSAAESDRPRPPIVRYVEDLGGRILNSVMSEATHVVAAKDGTDKIVAARKVPGCVVVKTAWLMECVWSLTRRDELQHVLGPAPRPVPANGSQVRPLAESKRENSSASSDDDEDDEFAAELESDFL